MSKKSNWLDFEAIKAEASIERILQNYNLLDKLELKNNAYVGRCPFGTKEHGKKDSFNFSLKKRTFKCFACKNHGSVLDFVAKYQGVHLREAAEIILEIMGGDDKDSPIFGDLSKLKDLPKLPEQEKFIESAGALGSNNSTRDNDQEFDSVAKSNTISGALSNVNVDDLSELSERDRGSFDELLKLLLDEEAEVIVPKPISYRKTLVDIKESRKVIDDFIVFDSEEFYKFIAGIKDNLRATNGALSCLERFITEQENEDIKVGNSKD